jgi:hypothetical protein
LITRIRTQVKVYGRDVAQTYLFQCPPNVEVYHQNFGHRKSRLEVNGGLFLAAFCTM